MSLVLAIISDSFILVCGDQRAIFKNGKSNENFNKVFKLNKNIVIGTAGDISDNLKLFEGFIYSDNENQKLISYTNCLLSLNEFTDIIVERFKP